MIKAKHTLYAIQRMELTKVRTDRKAVKQYPLSAILPHAFHQTMYKNELMKNGRKKKQLCERNIKKVIENQKNKRCIFWHEEQHEKNDYRPNHLQAKQDLEKVAASPADQAKPAAYLLITKHENEKKSEKRKGIQFVLNSKVWQKRITIPSSWNQQWLDMYWARATSDRQRMKIASRKLILGQMKNMKYVYVLDQIFKNLHQRRFTRLF